MKHAFFFPILLSTISHFYESIKHEEYEAMSIEPAVVPTFANDVKVMYFFFFHFETYSKNKTLLIASYNK